MGYPSVTFGASSPLRRGAKAVAILTAKPSDNGILKGLSPLSDGVARGGGASPGPPEAPTSSHPHLTAQFSCKYANTFCAMGAATLPPVPPSSTRTVTA